MKDAFSHFPGTEAKRHFEGYSPYQQILWEAYDDSYHARVFGFGHTRKPFPGAVYNDARFKAWRNKMLNQSYVEAQRDAGTRGLVREDFTDSELLYLYERMVAADIYTTQAQLLDD